MRYFFVSFMASNRYTNVVGNKCLSSEKFPSKKDIKSSISRTSYKQNVNAPVHIEGIEITNIFEFKCQQDYLDFIG